MKIYTWNNIPVDELSPTAKRQALHGEQMTLAHFKFDKGNVVASHHHVNDQITTVAKGSIMMTVGEEEFQMNEGDMVLVPPDVPHGNVALEDTIIVEIFAPVRQDWISGDDSYLRGK